VVETTLEQLRPLLIHAKRKEDLRMMQKILSNPHNFDSSLTFHDISLNFLSLHRFSHVKHCTVKIVYQTQQTLQAIRKFYKKQPWSFSSNGYLDQDQLKRMRSISPRLSLSRLQHMILASLMASPSVMVCLQEQDNVNSWCCRL